MASLNSVQIIGNLGQDPEMRYTQNQKPVANFSIATTEQWGEQKKTEWHKIVVWDKLAENCSKYLKKGSCVFVEGRISTRSWTDSAGVIKYTTEIIASNVQFLTQKQTTEQTVEQTTEQTKMSDDISCDDIPF